MLMHVNWLAESVGCFSLQITARYLRLGHLIRPAIFDGNLIQCAAGCAWVVIGTDWPLSRLNPYFVNANHTVMACNNWLARHRFSRTYAIKSRKLKPNRDEAVGEKVSNPLSINFTFYLFFHVVCVCVYNAILLQNY